MKLTPEQHRVIIEGIALEIADMREEPDHNYNEFKGHRNVCNFLSGLLISATFGDEHETMPVALASALTGSSPSQ
jgi:hypothetical protein